MALSAQRNLLISRIDRGQGPTASISGGGFEPQLPGSNMLTIQTQLVAQATGGSVSFTLDLGGTFPIGIVTLQRLVCDPPGSLSVSWGGFTFAGTAWPQDANGTYDGSVYAGLNRPRVIISPEPQLTGTVNVSISSGGLLQIGYIGAFEVWESPGGFNLQSKIEQLDLSDVQIVPFGSPYVTFRGKPRRLNVGADWLKDGRPYGALDEADLVKELFAINGYSSPVIGIRYPDDVLGLEKDAVWGHLTAATITNSFFATSAAAFQIDQWV